MWVLESLAPEQYAVFVEPLPLGVIDVVSVNSEASELLKHSHESIMFEYGNY